MTKIVKSPGKHYSPLRYPGGKSCLSEFLSNVIKLNNIDNCTYVEPFAGGAGAALTLLFLEKVDNIVINDFDKSIYSFWRSILTQTDAFIDKIYNTPVTINEWRRQREIYRDKRSRQLDLGFATFFMNRTNRSGIIEGGPIGGAKQNGKWLIDARFNKDNLVDRIMAIASYRSRIRVTNLDGIDLLRGIHRNPDQFIYLDPPYFIKGSSLYLNHYLQENHERLASFLNNHNRCNWILTYDDVPQIRALYQARLHYDFRLHYHVGQPKLGQELLVVSDRIQLN
jgi:DNA adenine methylase